MPGLHIDEVGGGKGGAIIPTVYIYSSLLPEQTPLAVLNYLNRNGISKGDRDTLRIVVKDSTPINPEIILSDQIIETEPVLMQLVDSNGDPHPNIKDFRVDGESDYYQDALIGQAQWKEGSSEEMVNFPVDWHALYREFYGYLKTDNADGVEMWYYVIPMLEVVDGKLKVAFDIDYENGVEADGRAINIDYKLENPDAVLKLVRIVNDFDGVPAEVIAVDLIDEYWNSISRAYAWGDKGHVSENYVYFPANLEVRSFGVTTNPTPQQFRGFSSVSGSDFLERLEDIVTIRITDFVAWDQTVL